MLFTIIIATLIVSLISLIGVVFIGLRKDILDKLMESFISIASGSLIGGALIHLLPESFEAGGESSYLYVIFGIIFFFALEKFLKWRHCHDVECDVHAFTYLNLIGDGFHNLIDGMIIAAAFMSGFNIGVIATIAVIAHEIPQEIGDYAILVYGGFGRVKALIFNLISALMAIVGAVAAYFLISHIEGIQPALLALTAGGFIYIALADLVPELHKKMGAAESILQTFLLMFGIFIMYILKFIAH